MSITVTIKDKTPERLKGLEGAVERFVVKAAGHIEGELKASMAEPKSGRRYGKHTASAPGESPAIDSSNLTGSIAILQANSLEAKIGTPVEYAVYLEEGTSNMAARPLWERTARESLPTLEQMLQNEIGA